MYILNGGDVFRLQKLMSHADISTTRVPVNLFADDLKEKADNLFLSLYEK